MSDETRIRIIEKIENSPKKSLRRSSSELGVPRTTMRRIIKVENFYPLKLQQMNKLYEDDPDRRFQIVTWFQDQLIQNPNFVNHDVLFSDEANFFVNGEFNKQNCRYYSHENPNWMDPTEEHSCPKVIVWCGLWRRNHVFGPVIFQRDSDRRGVLKIAQNNLMPHSWSASVKENHFGLCMVAPRLSMRPLCEIGWMIIMKVGLGEEAP